MSEQPKDPGGWKPAERRRGGKGFRHAAETARKSVDRIVGRKGFAEAEVLLRWAEIVGTALAATCRPVKVHYGASRSLGATLVVEADSGRAPEITHLGPTILERVNRFYGYRAISRMRVTHGSGPAPGLAEQQTAFAGPEPRSAAHANRKAAELANGIENPELRAALTRMGSHVLSRNVLSRKEH